jgi:type VI secretion system protein ImpA
MPDATHDASVLSPPFDRWLLPLGDGQACGPDLEYDPESLELEQTAGTPASQFGPGEPPNWPRMLELSESLLSRTRDLRVAMRWGRAKLNLDGVAALPAVLALLHGLLDQFWDDLHPLPDADDPNALARLSVIGGLDKLDSLLGDIRNARLSDDRRLEGLRVRDVEVALSKLAARPGEASHTQAEIARMMADQAAAADALRTQADASLSALEQLEALMSRRFSADSVVDLTTVRAMLSGIKSVLPASRAGDEPEVAAGDEQRSTSPLRAAAGVHSIESRQDAVRAIELVCAYLERSEPTNPAQMLLRRAARVIDKDFLQLVRELAPDAVRDVARIMGVDPNAGNDTN